MRSDYPGDWLSATVRGVRTSNSHCRHSYKIIIGDIFKQTEEEKQMKKYMEQKFKLGLLLVLMYLKGVIMYTLY